MFEDRAVTHKTNYYIDNNTLWREIDAPITVDVRVRTHNDDDYFTATIVGGFSELAGLYVKNNEGCTWLRNTIHIAKDEVDIESFIKSALSWHGHNVFVYDNDANMFKAIRLCYY